MWTCLRKDDPVSRKNLVEVVIMCHYWIMPVVAEWLVMTTRSSDLRRKRLGAWSWITQHNKLCGYRAATIHRSWRIPPAPRVRHFSQNWPWQRSMIMATKLLDAGDSVTEKGGGECHGVNCVIWQEASWPAAPIRGSYQLRSLQLCQINWASCSCSGLCSVKKNFEKHWEHLVFNST